MNEWKIGLVLRIGVFSAAFVAILGMALVFLAHNSIGVSLENAKLVVRASLLLLIYLQILRVFLTGWLFIARREWIFVACSVFIFIVLSYSVFWKI